MTTILFFVSLFVLALLVVSRIFAVNAEVQQSTPKMFLKSDEAINKFIDFAVFKYNRYKKIGHIFLFEFIPSYAYELLVKMKDYVSKKYYSSADGFRGRRVLRSNGSVSFFLESLSDDKTQPEARKV